MSDFSSGTSSVSMASAFSSHAAADRRQLRRPCPPPGRRGPAPSPPPGSMPSRPADPPRWCGSGASPGRPTFRAMVRAPPRPPNTAPSRSPAPVTSSSVCFVDCAASAWRTRSSAVATAARARSIFDSKRFARTATCASAPASAATSQRAANSACDSPGRLTSFSSRLAEQGRRCASPGGARRSCAAPS